VGRSVVLMDYLFTSSRDVLTPWKVFVTAWPCAAL